MKNEKSTTFSYMKRREVHLLLFILLLTILLTAINSTFISATNIKDILLNVSYVIVASVGMNLILITGNIDISFGGMLAVLSLTAATLCEQGVHAAVYYPVTIVMGALLGMINGFVVTKLRVPAIITTLAMNQILRGGILVFTQGYWVTNLPRSWYNLGNASILGLQTPLFVALIVSIATILFMRYAPFARSIYAVGSNKDAAMLVGINADRVIWIVYIIAGAFVGLATMVYATRFTAVQSNAGVDFEMTCITAAIIGGTSTKGGTGTFLGTILGALLVGMIRTGLVLSHVSSYWEQAFIGMVILISVLISSYEDIRRGRE